MMQLLSSSDTVTMDSIKQPEILKQGVLGKQGGGAGGHKNWKDRYFVLSDHLYYYNNQQVSLHDKDAPGLPDHGLNPERITDVRAED